MTPALPPDVFSREAAKVNSPGREPGDHIDENNEAREAGDSAFSDNSKAGFEIELNYCRPLRGLKFLAATRSPGLRPGLLTSAASRLTDH